MAILQISRIQLRRGLQENLPQLASGEMGWSLDQRKLWIGNGTPEEGAPSLGNTEILTQYSDIFSLSGVYTYEGLAAGYQVQTGLSSISPVSRSMQDKFDDIVNLRDFYTGPLSNIGDGQLHDTAGDENAVHYINRAITQLHVESVTSPNPRARRVLNIPAGVYLITGDFIRLLPYVKLIGEGKNSTFIIQQDPLQPCVVCTCDSTLHTGFLYNIDGNPSTPIDSPNFDVSPSTIPPGYLEVEGITFLNSTDNDTLIVDSVTGLLFNSVSMKGGQSNPSIVGTGKSCVRINYNVGAANSNPSTDINFLNCDFTGQIYGIYTDSQTNNVNVVGSKLSSLYRGINLGENNPGDTQPSSIKISHSSFKDISLEGIFGSGINTTVTNVVSAFNVFEEVGNNYTLIPVTSAISFGGDNCYSIGDLFVDRSSSDDFQAVNLNGRASFATLSEGRVQLGRQYSVGGQQLTLTDDQPSNVTAAVIGLNLSPTILEYSIVRDVDSRVGSMKILPYLSTVAYEDDYIESSDIGVILQPVISGGAVELQYTSTATGNDAILTTSFRTLV